MKKILLFLLLACSLSANAQVNKKLIHFMLAGGGSSAPSQSITNVTFDFDILHYTDEDIQLTATPSGGATILMHRWEWKDKNGGLVQIAFGETVTIPAINATGFYDLTYTAHTSTDSYSKTWTDLFIDYERFDEVDADIVIDLSSDATYFNNFAEADNSGLKIYIKGSGTGEIELVGLKGTENDPVRIQKSNDNTDVTLTGDGSSHALYIYGDNEWIRFNGFNVDKSIGFNVVGHASGAQVIAVKDGGFTGIQFFGISTTHSTTVEAASFSLIPDTDAEFNAVDYLGEKLYVWGCEINNAGDEGIYMGYNTDALQSGERPVKFYECVVSWNVINGSGRDGIQPGGCEVTISNNEIYDWGQQHDTSHESAMSLNGGSYGVVHSNYMRGGEMWANIQSGAAPFNVYLGETAARGWEIYGNDFANGTYTAGGSTEAFCVYVQTSNVATATTNIQHNFYNNTIKTDKKFMEAFFYSNSWTWTGFNFVNNLIVKVGTAGDGEEYNFTGPGTQPTGSTINNLVRNNGSESDILFTDYANNDLTISSLSSPVYTGATDVSSYYGTTDYDGYPLNASGFAYGAYSGYNKKVIAPTVGDPDPATFSTPLAIGTLTQSGGTITYEADKVGILYWAITTDGGAAPDEDDLRDGGYGLASGSIIDTGTADDYIVSTLSIGTAYDLHGIFVTIDNVPQASVTKVDFTTTADVVAPTISAFAIPDANRDRINFTSSEIITASTVGGFTVATPTKTISSVTINAGQTTGHYFTVSVPFVYGETPTLAYSGSGSNLVDGSSNALASFGATAITNNIAAGVAEPVVVNLNDDVTVSGANSNDFTSTSTSAYVTSTQIIPSGSNGYIQYNWDQDSRNTVRIGFIDAADASPVNSDVKLWLNLSAANHNIDYWQGSSYIGTYTTSGYNQSGTKYRIFINRSTQKITALASNNDFASSVTIYTSSTNFTGDFRFIFFTAVNGAQAMNCYIQADLGLN